VLQENDALRREQERATSPEEVQVLHEEMIVCKLREAESSMVTKQLQNDLFEIQRLWQVCLDYQVFIEDLRDSGAVCPIPCVPSLLFSTTKQCLYPSCCKATSHSIAFFPQQTASALW